MSDLVHLCDLANDLIRSSNSEFTQSLPSLYGITGLSLLYRQYVLMAAFSTGVYGT